MNVLLIATLALPVLARDERPQRYEQFVAELDPFIAREVAEKKLPGLSIAIVDDRSIVWSKGYGFADAARKVPATGDTVYRVGAVSQLVTALALMQLVEAGQVDLDAPVTTYLPDFAPRNPFGAAPVTLRQLMARRSGLVREPPVGNDSDPTSPSLEAIVASLNSTELVSKPGSRAKYSNAAIAAVGLALEKVEGRPFAGVVGRRVLEPLKMTRSGFASQPEWGRDLAIGTMWTEFGREFAAPTFELGIGPAVGLYSTANDLARLLMALFAGGRGATGSILKSSTLDEMLKVQFAGPGHDQGFGLGFSIGQLGGHRRVGLGGGIYGFAAEIAALPDETLGVVVITSKDSANALTARIADVALALMMSNRDGKTSRAIPRPTATLYPGATPRWAGHYRARDRSFDLIECGGRLWMEPGEGGHRVELRGVGQDFVGDDVRGFGPALVQVDARRLRLDGETFERTPVGLPAAPPAHLDGLIGEYGRDHDVLYILEKGGRLHALTGWFFLHPLAEKSPDVFEFLAAGPYPGETLVFRRDPGGRAVELIAGGVAFRRRPVDGEGGRTFKITPARPVEEIRREAVGMRPPVEVGKKEPDLVELLGVVPGIRLDIRYASTNNFLGVPLYTSARALMQRPAADSLARVQARLEPMGYGLLVHDAYRPWRVTRLFWEATPAANHVFVADPAQGSRHNRGCAVDLTLCDLASGRPVEMVGGYDEFSDRSYPLYPGGTARQRWHRDLLRRVMEGEGFTVFEAEWWHFDYRAWRDYPILDIPFEDLP